MQVIVLGANGMLGKYVHKYFIRVGADTTGTTRCYGFDARTFEKSEPFKTICEHYNKKEFFVINCIGAIKQRTKDPEELFAINANFPIRLAKFLCRFDNAHLIHISTDCVFSGNGLGLYFENDPKDAEDFYGQSKALGEECSKFDLCRVIRTSIIGEDPRSNLSFLEWVRSQSGGIIKGYSNHYWNGVTCLELAKACETLILSFNDAQKISHLSTEPVSKYQLATKIAEIYGLNIQIEMVEASVRMNRLLATFKPLHTAPSLDLQIKAQKEWSKF